MAVKVLLVDDDSLLRNLFNKRLEQAGYEVALAVDGQDGLSAAEEFLPDVILLDYQMPKLNGDEMLSRMRQTEWGQNMPVILMSAISSLEEVADIEQANLVMYKPITNRELLQAIKDVLQPSL
jgi:DNA-binding response OmpR family regulator